MLEKDACCPTDSMLVSLPQRFYERFYERKIRMILIDAADKKKYWVHFRHISVTPSDPLFRLSDHKTQAAIHEGPCRLPREDWPANGGCGTPAHVGEAHCSRVDRFDRNTGRKQALLNAMIGPDEENPIIPKEIRERLWTDYFAQRYQYEPYRDPHLSKRKGQAQGQPGQRP